jgi:hypothetical protein
MLPSETAGAMPLLCVVVGSVSLGLFGCPPAHPPKLTVSATVNQRAASPDPLVRVGDPVVVALRVGDSGGRGLTDVRVTVSGTLGGAVVCPSGNGTIAKLSAGQSVDCFVRTTAQPGAHDATVTVTGRSGGDHDDDDDQGDEDGDGDDDGYRATAKAGYRGVGGGLSASETVTVAPDSAGGTATLSATVRNIGNVPVFDLAASDPAVSGITCASPAAGLAPGASAACSAVVHLAPGAYHSVLTVIGSDRTTTVGGGGGDVAPPTLHASAAADFTVVALPSVPPPSSPPPPPPPVVPPPGVSSPTPTPSPTPSPTPAPVPPRPAPSAVHGVPAAAAPPSPGLKPSLFLLVMMMPASATAAVLAARRK